MITSFKGPYFFLSNFYMRPVPYNGVHYPSAEHAYQAQKVSGSAIHDQVRFARTPALAKRIARSYPCPSNWDEIKVDIMKNVLRGKFARHVIGIRPNVLCQWLLDTGDKELIEGNDWGDTFWGQCPVGNGENMLGKLLMKVRGELRG